MSGMGWIRVGAALGFLAVGFGAFGAHGLKDRLELLGTTTTYETAVQYHFYHAMAVLAVGLMAGLWGGGRTTDVAGWSFLLGVLVFSGSLYVLALTGMRWLGAITPIGGVAMLVGWVALGWGATRHEAKPPAAAADERMLREAIGQGVEGSR